MRSWKGLSGLAEDFEETGVRLLGISADSPRALGRMRSTLGLPFTMLSDPSLSSLKLFDVPTSSGHPMSRKYPEGAFLQPAYFVLRAGGDGGQELLHEWVQRPGMLNAYGAMGRPSPADMLNEARGAVGGDSA